MMGEFRLIGDVCIVTNHPLVCSLPDIDHLATKFSKDASDFEDFNFKVGSKN